MDGGIRVARDDIERILRMTAEMPHNSVLLYGPPGTGKSTSAMAARRPGQDKVVVGITEEMSATGVVGHFLVKAGDTVYHDNAPGLYAMDNGLHLVLNEIDKASGDLVDVLYVMLDDRETCVFRLADGREVSAQPGYRVIATTNADPDQLPEALRDRFAIVLPVLRPPDAAMHDLPGDVALAVTRTYDVVEKRYLDAEHEASAGRDMPSLTYRQMRNFAEFRTVFGEEVAALMVTGRGGRARALVEAMQVLRAEIAQTAGPAAGTTGTPAAGTAVRRAPGRDALG